MMRPLHLSKLLAALLLAQAFFSGIAIASETRPAVASVAQLQSALDAHFGQERFRPALWSVKVVSLDTGRTLYEHHADRLMSPASNCKLFTGALALERLGADHRIATPIVATAKPDARGRLKGDLIVRGRCDPSWTTSGGQRTWAQMMEPFVSAVVQAGIKRISGDIVADATYIRGPAYGSGWDFDDLDYDYGAEVSAITLEDNCARLTVAPAQVGQPCVVRLAQPQTGLVLVNQTRTLAAGHAAVGRWDREPGTKTYRLTGGLPEGAKTVELEMPVPRPADWFAAALKEALESSGVRVEGRARSVRWPEPAPAGGAEFLVGQIQSPPMRDLVRAFMKPSQNLETDLIFAYLGEAARTLGTDPAQTSERLAVVELGAFLGRSGLPAGEVLFEEGSGLSRNNLATANSIVALLRFMAAGPNASDFASSLPIAGVDGTLRHRLQGAPTEGNVRAKTGSLRWAKSLSGYVTTAAGERLAFSLMLNRSAPPAGRESRADLDDVAALLAGLAARSDANAP